jgi:sugar lactone lactonase YvrE
LSGEIWLRTADGKAQRLDYGLKAPTGIALSPDNLWLAVAERGSHFGYSYPIKSDGTLDARQRFYWLHVADADDAGGATSLVFDREGHLFAATDLGVQVFDRNGRSRLILRLPDEAPVIALAFGQKDSGMLYARSATGHTFRRALKIPGVPLRERPVTVPKVSPG